MCAILKDFGQEMCYFQMERSRKNRAGWHDVSALSEIWLAEKYNITENLEVRNDRTGKNEKGISLG